MWQKWRPGLWRRWKIVQKRMQGNQEVRTVTANFFQEKQREIDNTCIEFKHMTLKLFFLVRFLNAVCSLPLRKWSCKIWQMLNYWLIRLHVHKYNFKFLIPFYLYHCLLFYDKMKSCNWTFFIYWYMYIRINDFKDLKEKQTSVDR